VVVIDVQGEMFFATAEELELRLKALFKGGASFVVVRLQQAFNIDATCVEALEHVAALARRQGGRLILAGVRPGMLGTFERAGLVKELGADCVFPSEKTLLSSTHKAIAHAEALAARSTAHLGR
jgi:SulP family sulfate permease